MIRRSAARTASSTGRSGGDPPLRLVFSQAAKRALARLSKSASARLVAELDGVANAPFAYHSALEPRAGRTGAFRLDADPWAALIRIDRGARVLYVDSIVYFGER